jgi:hypothetical protein
MRWSCHARGGLLLGLIAVGLGCGDSTSPAPSLVGGWELVSFTDHGVVGTTTGTMTFDLNGTWAMVGTVTYPGEPIDSLRASGTYTAMGNTVVLTAGPDTGTWSLAWSDSTVTLTLQGPLPTNVIVLRRQT